MHKSLTVLIALFLMVGSVVAQSTPVWIRHAPAGGGYAVMLPDKPEEQNLTREQYNAKIYTLVLKDDQSTRVIYMVGVGDYASTRKVDPALELPADRDSFIKGLPGMKLVESHDITMDGRPGIEVSGESAQATVTARFYIKGNRVYQIAALVRRGVDEKENVTKFFDSFAFID